MASALEPAFAAAREWLADCGYQGSKNDLSVAHLIRTHFEGGWPEFLACSPDLAPKDVIWLLMVRRFDIGIANLMFP